MNHRRILASMAAGYAAIMGGVIGWAWLDHHRHHSI